MNTAENASSPTATTEATTNDKPRRRRRGGRSNDVLARYSRIGSRPGFKHEKCMDKICITFSPATGKTFSSKTVSVDALRMHSMASANPWDGNSRMSAPLATFAPRVDTVTAQVHYDAVGHVEHHDAGLSRHTDSPLRLQVSRDRGRAKLAVAMSEATEAQCEGRFLPQAPAMPSYLFASDPAQPLKPELGNQYLIEAARNMYELSAETAPTTGQLAAAFHACAETVQGLTCYPQELFLRDGRPDVYAEHPVTSSARPALGDKLPADDAVSPCGGWVFKQSAWYPLAQVPRRAYAVLPDGMLGRGYRNPAFSVLKTHGVLPETADYKNPDELQLNKAADTWALLQLGLVLAANTVTEAYEGVESVMQIEAMDDSYVRQEDAKIPTEKLPEVVAAFRTSFTDPDVLERLQLDDEELMACIREPRRSLQIVTDIIMTLRSRLGGVSDRCTSPAIAAALHSPMLDIFADLEASMQVIQLAGTASPETAAFSGIDGHVRPLDYAPRFANAMRVEQVQAVQAAGV